MSYKIEITAATTAELAGKLLALAATMHATPADPVMPEVKEAAKPAKKTKKAEEVAEEQPAGEPATAAGETASLPSDIVTAQPETSESSVTLKNTDVSSENSGSAEAPAPLDFDTDVAPVVLAAVKEKGKPWVQEILSQFGVERASQVPDEQMGEFLNMVREAL